MAANKTKRDLPEPLDVLYRIKRGLAGYVSYLAACEMNESFSEYVLYEPILRILTARGFTVQCEVECPGIEHARSGDRKRLDFVATTRDLQFALEVKWAKRKSLDVSGDVAKLAAYAEICGKAVRAFLCVFGRESLLANLSLTPQDALQSSGKIVTADFGKTKYSCRVYEYKRR